MGLLQDFIDDLNSRVFFKEFTFAGPLLSVGSGEVELADHFVLLEDLAIVFQLKERSPEADSSEDAVSSWFQSKVLKRAKNQIKASLRVLSTCGGRTVVNQRGHAVRLPGQVGREIHNVIVFRAPVLPNQFDHEPIYYSDDVGPIHVIQDVDYFGICRHLVTPREIARYLAFRALILRLHPFVDEPALVGQFLLNDLESAPSAKYRGAFAALVDDTDDWNLSKLIREFADHVVPLPGVEEPQDALNYYAIIAELAKLSRSELRELKKRILLAVGHARRDQFEPTTRVSFPHTDCAFLVFAVPAAMWGGVQRGLLNLCIGSQYQLQVKRHIGIAVGVRGEVIDLVWCFREWLPEHIPELEARLEKSNPFRPLRRAPFPNYLFDSDALRELGLAEHAIAGAPPIAEELPRDAPDS